MRLIHILLMMALMWPGWAYANGGKNRLGDDLIDEVYQLCKQAGLEEGNIEVEICSGPEGGNCIVIRVDCSQDPSEDDD